MDARTLAAEYHAAVCRSQPPKARAWREAQGFPRHAAAMGLGGGVCRVSIDASGTYQPLPEAEGGGVPAILFPVWSGPAPGFRPEDMLDVVAYVPSLDESFTRRGLADVLGEWAVSGCECLPVKPAALHVYRSPVAWAAGGVWDGPHSHGGHGISVIDWTRVRSRLGHLVGAVDFEVDDIDTGRRLRAALDPPPSHRPRILVGVEAA